MLTRDTGNCRGAVLLRPMCVVLSQVGAASLRPYSEAFQGLETDPPGFSKDWKISRKIFQGLENFADFFPSLGKPRLWLVDLDAAAEFDREDWLDGNELARAARLRSSVERQRFVRSHAIARLLLAEELGVAPAAVAIERTATGKPFIAGAAFDFSLSHSENLFLFGIQRGGALGVDVEIVSANFVWQPVAEDFFSAMEQAELKAAPAAERARLFHRLWTLREARAKAVGDGIAAASVEQGGGWTYCCAEISVSGKPASVAVVWRK